MAERAEYITLLVADDEPVVRTFVRRFIHKQGLPVACVFEAANGREAVALAKNHMPDLLLLDIRMPGIDGLEAAAVIMKQRPDARIVMVTAYDEFEYARSALRIGVTDYLLKPLNPEALARHVTDALQRKRKGLAHNADLGIMHPLVTAVRRYVDAHLCDSLRLEDIANAVHVSASHCSRTFSKYAGMSISEFVATRRMARAEELLECSFMSMTEIAGVLGFSSSAYFASWFKRAKGISPMQHRKARARVSSLR